MKRHRVPISHQRFSPQHKAQLLDEFERLKISVAVFAANNGIGTSTVFAWLRQRRRQTLRTKPLPTRSPFQQVSLASVLGSGGPWVGEVQLPDGTQVRWGSQVVTGLLHEVLAHLRGPC